MDQVWGGRISPSTLRDYSEDRHTALLASLIFITRVILQFHSTHSQNILFDVSSRTLSELLSNMDMRFASPEMRNEYCGLWNDLVQEAWNASSYTPTITTDILRRLRKSYIALHESTDASLFYTSTDDNALLGSSYPLCSVHDHRHTCSQTLHPATANLSDSTCSPPPHSPPLISIPPIAVVGATEDASDAPEVSAPAEASPDLAVAPLAPTPPLPRPSIEMVQESHG